MFPDIARDDVFRLETPRLWLRWPQAADAPAISATAAGGKWRNTLPAFPIPIPGNAERFIFAAREGNTSGRDLTLVMTPTAASARRSARSAWRGALRTG